MWDGACDNGDVGNGRSLLERLILEHCAMELVIRELLMLSSCCWSN